MAVKGNGFSFGRSKAEAKIRKSYGIGSTATDTTPGCSGCGPSIDDEPNVLARIAPDAVTSAE
jgi:hypothetical protein